MPGINKVILIGNLGKNPELRFTPSGIAVCNFTVATSETWKDKDSGEKKEATEWHRVVVWRKLAEVCGEYLEKGSKIYLEGKLQTKSWEKNDETRYGTVVVAEKVEFLSSRIKDGKAGDKGMAAPAEPGEGNFCSEDDIPF